VRTVGQGSFGKVYLVKHKVERKLYCLKTIKLEGIPESERRACQMEVKLLTTMQHPNIVGFKESFVARQGKLLCIVMTYCDGGDLSERLKLSGSTLIKEDQILHWFVQLALGLHFMHDMNDKCVLHRDLKTQNIFLLGNGRLVIGDLGISKVLENETDFTKTTIGTPYYMSPEVYKSKPYNHKSDVWALGCILYEMATLKHAFNAKSLNGLMGKVVKGNFDPISSRYSRNLNQLVNSMLCIDPNSRPSLPEILSLPFVKKHVYRFLHHIAERPRGEIGDGTMVLRKAGMGITEMTGRLDNSMESQQTKNLRRQLKCLGMQDLVNKAFHNACISPSENISIASNAVRPPDKRCEQKNSLILERERKRAVEKALENLRKERVARADERRVRVERQQRRELLERKRQNAIRESREPDKKPEVVRDVDRWRNNNPVYIANQKAKDFQRNDQVKRKEQLKHQPDVEGIMQISRIASSPPPPPPPSQKDNVLATKEERKRQQEGQHKEVLRKAAQDRLQELREAHANELKQYHNKPAPESEMVALKGDDMVDDFSDSDSESSSSAFEEADKDDGDISEKEEELMCELKAVTMKCSSLRKTLRQAKGVEVGLEDESDDDDISSEEEEEEERRPPSIKIEVKQPLPRQHRVSRMDETDSEGSSSDDDLFSPVPDMQKDAYVPAKPGGLKSRIALLQEECIGALGKRRFATVYQLLKSSLEHKLYEAGHANKPSTGVNSEKEMREKIENLLSPDGKISYWRKIDNLIFMQETI